MFSKYFSQDELFGSKTAKKRGISNVPTDYTHVVNMYNLAKKMDRVRERLGWPITVNSGFRSPALNYAVGGVPTSQHLTGDAMDVTTTKGIYNLLNCILAETRNGIDFGQIIVYKDRGFIHVSNPTKYHRNELIYK